MFFKLFDYRELLINLVKRDLRARYKVTVLGFFWSLIRPLFTMVILYLVFSKIFRWKIDMEVPFPFFLLCAILPWGFVIHSLYNAANSLVGNANLIKKTKLPREVFPLSAVLAELINLILSLGMLFIFLLFFGIKPSVWLFFLPVILLIHFILVFGLALVVSSLNVFYRDTLALMDLFLMAWFYLTPIFYPVSMVAAHIKKFWYQLYLLINPLTPLFTGYRKVLLANKFSSLKVFGADFKEWLLYLAVAFLISVVILFVGTIIFRHFDSRFVDEL